MEQRWAFAGVRAGWLVPFVIDFFSPSKPTTTTTTRTIRRFQRLSGNRARARRRPSSSISSPSKPTTRRIDVTSVNRRDPSCDEQIEIRYAQQIHAIVNNASGKGAYQVESLWSVLFAVESFGAIWKQQGWSRSD
jgi:hypothetical protein